MVEPVVWYPPRDPKRGAEARAYNKAHRAAYDAYWRANPKSSHGERWAHANDACKPKKEESPQRVNGQPAMIYVEWIDSSRTDGWCTAGDVQMSLEPHACISCGFLVSETAAALVLAQNHSHAPNTGRPWGQLMTIPKVAITLRAHIEAFYGRS